MKSLTSTDTFAFIGRFGSSGTDAADEALEKLSKQEEGPATVTKIVRTTGIIGEDIADVKTRNIPKSLKLLKRITERPREGAYTDRERGIDDELEELTKKL